MCAPALADEYGLPPLIEGLTRSLVTQAVTAFTSRGNTVAVTGPDAARIAAIADSVGDRRVLCVDPETVTIGGHRDRVGGGARTPDPGSVDLLLAAELPAPWIDTDGQPYTTWARWLAPGGVLVVATRNPAGQGRFADHTGAVVTAATNAGLSYLQHIIAVLAHIQGDRLLISSPPGLGHAARRRGARRRAHGPARVPHRLRRRLMSTYEPIPQQALTRGSDALVELPVTVWPTAQQAPRTQRGTRYVPEATAHPAKMLPAIVRHAIDTFTAPGDLVLDPMCGVGTTLVEAVHKGRDALGIEYENRWAEVSEANLVLAADDGGTGRGEVHVGDARQVLPDLADRYTRRVGLLVTSPPYGSSVHGQVHAPGHRPVRKHDNRYSRDRANLAHRSLPMLLRGFTDILRRAVPLLQPGGVVAITTRPFRVDGELIDFPSLTLDAAINAGLDPVQRCVGLLAGLRDGKLVPRSSFFQLDYVRKLRDRGVPAWVIAHEDILVLRVGQQTGTSSVAERPTAT